MRELAKYEDASGREVTLTDVDIKRVICDNPNVTDKEMKLFVELCKAQRLNPFVKEAYLVKYGGNPATMVVGKDVYTKRAQANPRFRGLQAGVFVVDGNGKGKEREGSMVLPGETPVGAWCKVFVEGYDVPIYDSVSFDEYAGKKRDGSLNSTWAGKPGTMIRKVAVVHALREAFPEDFQGLYDAAEMEQAMRPPDEGGEPSEVVCEADAVEVSEEAVCEGEAVEEPPTRLDAAMEDARAATADALTAAKRRAADAMRAYCERNGADYGAEVEEFKENMRGHADDPSWFEAQASFYEAN